MAQKTLSDRARMSIALNAAAYMRWVETRKGRSPTAAMAQQFIKGTLSTEGYSYSRDEPETIESLALSLNVDMVEAFIKQTDCFEALDRAAKTQIGIPMGQRRLIDSLSFLVAAGAGALLRYSLETSWYVAGGAAILVFIALPFAISRYWALFLIRRAERAARRLTLS